MIITYDAIIDVPSVSGSYLSRFDEDLATHCTRQLPPRLSGNMPGSSGPHWTGWGAGDDEVWKQVE